MHYCSCSSLVKLKIVLGAGEGGETQRCGNVEEKRYSAELIRGFGEWL